jgi:endoglucanase
MATWGFGKWARFGAAGLTILSTGALACSDKTDGDPVARAALALENGDFEGGSTDPWWMAPGITNLEIVDGRLCATAAPNLQNRWDAAIGQGALMLEQGKAYDLRFTVTALQPASAWAVVQKDGPDYDNYVTIPLQLDTTPQTIQQTFTMGASDVGAQVAFQFGGATTEVTLCIDNVSIEPARTELVLNGSFDQVVDPWWGYGGVGPTVTDGRLCLDVPGGTTNKWDVAVVQSNIPLQEGKSYKFRFTALATAAGDQEVGIRALVNEPADPFGEFSTNNPTLGPDPRTFEYSFTMGHTDQVPQVDFQVGGAAFPWTFCLDDVAIVETLAENVVNGDFSSGTDPWWSYAPGNAPLQDISVSTGAYCATAPASTNIWDAGLGQTLNIEAGVTYVLSFWASGDPQGIHATVQNPTTYAEYGSINVVPTAGGDTYTTTFTATETVQGANLIFQVAASAARSFCVDNVSLLGGAAKPVYKPDTGPRVRVNQVAYVPSGPKEATLVTEAADPLPWQLLDGAGNVVRAGSTVPFGTDASSALKAHNIDFSAVTAPGEGYQLVADGETSYPFAIGTASYEALRVDSMRVYYTQRSGEPIEGAVAGAAYARPAGHISSPGSGDINQGDLNVPCQPASDSEPIYGEPWTCDYTLNVVGGWYDAGDHGKYVVNGGISVYQLLNAFERTKVAPSTDLGALGDGTLHVPEVGNGVPDILDEARVELEFFLSMRVPQGKPLAGMVHHKVHDNAWTGLPLAPNQDPMLRWLHRPSTAATLNLVATAAQAARIYARYDAAFADQLLAAARVSWKAALAHPDLYAPVADGSSGGGSYDDSDASDEFYWAAAELYITTGEREFRDFVLASPHHTANVFTPGGFYWGGVAALGRMDLATIPNSLPGRDQVIASVVAGATGYLADQAQNAFGQPYRQSDGGYVWGSNSQILNNLVVLGTAYDLTADESFRRGVLKGFDYLFGRNALNISYVTGYGTVYSQNQHSRLYAHELDPSLPHPPVGTVSGGPNSYPGTWDPTAQQLFGNQGCAPQFCYVDEIMSWSTNELTVNWNSPLVWIASFIADQDEADAAPFAACEVEYDVLGNRCDGKFNAEIRITNTGSQSISDWQLVWAFIGDQSIVSATSVGASQAGATVTLKPHAAKVALKPGRTVPINILAKRGKLANPEPATFFLNGVACRTSSHRHWRGAWRD